MRIRVYCYAPLRGFTLVELVTAIVIVGILGALALPRLFDNQAFSERGYVDEVASSLRYAQRIAIASRCEVSFAIGAASYSARQRSTLNACDSQSGAWTTQVRRIDGEPLAGIAPEGVAMSPATTVVFDPNGAVSSGNPPALTTGPFTLTIDAASGAITVLP